MGSRSMRRGSDGNSLKGALVVPRTTTSFCHTNNKGAIDWGWHGLLAYGAQCNICIIDTKTIQQVQCLMKHKASLKKVLWVPQEYELRGLSNVCLASSDANGCIIFWDSLDGKVVSSMQDGNKPILSIEWVPKTDTSVLYLAALHSMYSFTIWNISEGCKVWKKSFTDVLTSFCFDPFDFSKIAFLCPDCILFVDEFSVSRAPSTNGRKFYISSPRLAEENLRTRDRLKKLMRGLVVGENKPRPEDSMTISECQQLTYHKALRGHILLVYARDILLIDLHINMTVGVISIDKTVSPLVQVISCRERDVLYCLHESGTVSIRVRRRSNSTFLMSSPFDTPIDPTVKFDSANPSLMEKFLWYDQRCQSDSIRQTKGTKILGIAVCPVTQKNIAISLSNGKVVFLELEKVISSHNTGRQEEYILSHVLPPSTHENAILSPIRLVSYGMTHVIPWPITVIKMCPMDAARAEELNDLNQLHWLAVGSSTGNILIYNALTGSVYKEYSVHNTAVRGIEWCGMSAVLTWAQVESTGSKVKNEVCVTSLISGQSKIIRDVAVPESPIEFIRVSPMRQYFVVVKKDGKLELWSMRKLSMLRTMPDKFPFVKALEWSPIYSSKSQSRRKSEDAKEVEEGIGRRRHSSASTVVYSADDASVKEHLVCCNHDGTVYHFSVGNNTFQDGVKIPPENLMSPVTCLAFKGNKIVQADIEGRLDIWDLKVQLSHSINTARSTCISKIVFSPGKGNLKLLILYIDGCVDIYDLKQADPERIAHLTRAKDVTKILDIDWAAPNVPLLITEDGCILITDLNLSEHHTSLHNCIYEDPLVCVALVPSASLSVIHAWCSLQKPTEAKDDLLKSTSFSDVTQRYISTIPVQKFEDGCNYGIPDRSLLMSVLLCNVEDIRFWSVVSYYLQAASISASQSTDSAQKDNTCENVVEIVDNAALADKGVCGSNRFTNQYLSLQPLDTAYDFLCDSYTYQRIQLEQAELHEWKRGDYNHTQRVIERLILLGETDRAVQLLLETDISNPNYYVDSIKACLMAASQVSGTAQSTIKLVATNFIANGKIWEGVQLLCLINKRMDACRYLTSYNLWDSAVWLAKSSLTSQDTSDLMKKWSQHLKNNGDWKTAVLVLISQFQFEMAIEILLEKSLFEKAALLVYSCQQYGITISQDILFVIISLAFLLLILLLRMPKKITKLVIHKRAL